MARRKQKESGLDALIASPWWVSAVFAVGGYATFQWIIPSVTAGNRLFGVMGQTLKPFGTLIAAVCGLIAVVLYFKQRLSKPVELYRALEPREPVLGPTAAPTVTTPDALDHAWGDLIKKTGGSTPLPKPTKWSIELLRQIEWKRVEELTAAFFREESYRTETIRAGADGGIDVKLFTKDVTEPYAIVQCKAWNTQRVGVKPVRELLGVMAHEKVGKGIFVTTGDYTQEAIDFAKQNPIILITGEMLVNDILAFPDDAKARLLAVATEGDYTTPTCPSCGIKLVHRTTSRSEFWGCSNYPRCRTQIFTKTDIA